MTMIKKIDKKKNELENQTYYMPICMCLGMSIGTAIGVATDNMSMCMCLGVSFGLCIGSVIDARNRAKAKNKAEKPDEETD